MSSSKTIQKRMSTIASSSSAFPTPPPKQHFVTSLSATSAQSTPVTELHTIYDYNAHEQRRQKRTKEDGRWFPTPRPRYNSDGKKLKQGSSYPYPSGGNRLPFVKREDVEKGIVDRSEEVEIIWGCGKDHGKGEGRDRDAVRSAGMEQFRDKGKGKEKADEGKKMVDVKAGPHNKLSDDFESGRMYQGGSTSHRKPSTESTGISAPNRGSKRDTAPESTMTEQAEIRLEASQESRSHVNEFEPLQVRQNRAHERLSAGYWREDDGEADFENAQSIEPFVEGHPIFAEPAFASSPPASHSFRSSSFNSENHFTRIASSSPNLQYEDHRYRQGMWTGPAHPQVSHMRLFPNPEMNVPVAFDDLLQIDVLQNLVMMSVRYSPWAVFDTAAAWELPDLVNNFVTELKRSALRFPGLSGYPVGSHEQHRNDLDIEQAQLIRELSVLQELQGPLLRFREAIRLGYWDSQFDLCIMAVEEHDRLAAYRWRLLERLEAVRYEMRSLDGWDEGLDMDHLSLEEEDEHFQSLESGAPHCHWHQRFHAEQCASSSDFRRDQEIEEEARVRMEAKAQLEEYNKCWEMILSQPANAASSSTALARPLSIPYPVLSDTSPASSPSPLSLTSSTQAWQTHTFFCHAFNLTPYLEAPPADSPLSPPKPAFYASGSPESQIGDLMGLRKQLKMEKVRWYEDRLRAVFGDAAAREDRAKAVWGVVVELKTGVDEALDELERE